MITKQFAFFAFYTGLTMLLSVTELPIISEIGAIGFPLVFLVSGRRYGLYFIMLDTLASTVQNVQAVGLIGSMLSTAYSGTSSAAPILLPSIGILSPLITLGQATMLLAVFVFLGYSIHFYVRLLRRVKAVAKHNYRANGGRL